MGMAYFAESEKFDGDDINKNHKEEDEMKLEEITLSVLKEGRPELIASIETSAVEEKDKAIKDLETKIEEKDDEVTKLKKTVDDHEAVAKQNEKKTLVEKLLGESKLPDKAKTEVFRELLMKCEDTKETVDGKEKTINESDHMIALIKDREVLIGVTKSPIKDMGADEKKEVEEAEAQAAVDSGIFGIIPEKKEEEKK